MDKLVIKERKIYILEVDVEYTKELQKNKSEISFLVKRMKNKKVEKLAPCLKDKKTS